MLRVLFIKLVIFSSLLAGQKVVLLNDTSAWYHWGCTGTSTALKEHILKLGFEIESIPINTTYSLKEVPPFEEFGSLQSLECFQKANGSILQSIQNSDAVVINGEGTLHDLRLAPRSLLYLAYISKKFLNKHVEIINHSAYPKDDPLFSRIENRPEELLQAERFYKTVYKELDFVAIREHYSQETMNRIGVPSVLSFDCLPLYIRDHYRCTKKIQEKKLVISGSVACTELGASQLCCYLERLHQKGYKIEVLTGAAAFPAIDDETFVDYIKSHTKVPVDIISASSMEEWLDTINHATLLVSGRFHHSIAAFCLNTPFIALNSNTYKVHAICSLLGQEPPLLYSNPNLFIHLLDRTEKLLSAPLTNHLLKTKELCDLAEKNFEGLSRFLKEHR